VRDKAKNSRFVHRFLDDTRTSSRLDNIHGSGGAAYLARRGAPRTPADLLEHDGIIYGQVSGGQEWLFRRGTSETSVYLRTRLKLSAAEGVREAVLAGQGFAIASQWMFAPELKSGEVASVLDGWTLPPMDLWVIYPSGRLTSAKARTFIKWFEKTISPAA
jgi:DNA-binding transcriptional LysR family regulator